MKVINYTHIEIEYEMGISGDKRTFSSMVQRLFLGRSGLEYNNCKGQPR